MRCYFPLPLETQSLQSNKLCSVQKPRYEDEAVKTVIQYAISFYGVVAGLFIAQAIAYTISLGCSFYKKFYGKKHGNVWYVAQLILYIRISM